MTLVLEQVGKVVRSETHMADIRMELRPGLLNVLLGPTLSGKTSLMRLMAGSPKAKLANEKPQGETVDYDQLIQAWREGRVK
jgi:ABC-type sulfate/molybdate transport systems ATPase subunit